MNMAARMESTGAKNKVHLSADTAKILIQQGRQSWVIPREGAVQVKGKGECQTYWLSRGTSSGSHTGSTSSDEKSVENGYQPSQQGSNHLLSNSFTSKNPKKGGSWAGTFFDGVLGVSQIDDKLSRLVDWNVEVLAGLLRRIVARNKATQAIRRSNSGDASLSEAVDISSTVGTDIGTAREEIKMAVSLPGFDKKVVELASKEQVTLDPQVFNELREYVTAIASGYRSENAFHNFEHASHVILSSNKLMNRIVAPSEVGPDQKSELTAREVYEYTHGISNDPLTQFAIVFAALIHDGTLSDLVVADVFIQTVCLTFQTVLSSIPISIVGHPGVPNFRLAMEDPTVNSTYKGKSLAEQRSIDVAWQLLMLPRFENLRRSICITKTQCVRFRALLVNAVMATDIFDKDLKALREERWSKSFHMEDQNITSDVTKEAVHRKATIVVEQYVLLVA
jgi:hypothetical protein